MDWLWAVFTQANLEKRPSHQVPPQELFVVPKPGTNDWSAADQEHARMVDDAMDRLRQRTDQRRILMKPVFQDFDRCVCTCALHVWSFPVNISNRKCTRVD